MKLVDVYQVHNANRILYEWLKERSQEEDQFVNISHRKLPTWQQHLKFFHSKPYRHWFLIEVEERFVGYIYASERNEIGIVLARAERDKGYGTEAVELLIKTCKPLPEIPSKRRGCWLANINPKNERSISMFKKVGFTHIQNTYAL